ncbi:unnamed protein product [Callosobruchus maculatus]|uniref:Myb-like domain-containing protein n=1 Tax=Callosobruchus maculatus TaxID=64391 RepID=A0A653CMX6_CALMS|nr:unnamed protein product [Callosobruchus maculatus]
MWCPPTPPSQEGDMYVDQTMSFLYDVNVMSESQLPPIYVKRSSGDCKRSRAEAGLSMDGRRPTKMPRKEEAVQGVGGIANVPRSLFHSPAVLKMRRDLKLQKYRGLVRPSLPIPGKAAVQKPPVEQSVFHEWTIHEDMAILKVIQTFQGLPLNLLVMNPGHTPNWDFVADYVNTVSVTYRTPKQCKYRYEMVLIQREEGKQICIDPTFKKKKNKVGGTMQKFAVGTKASSRGMRTSQMYTQDNNVTFSQMMNERFEMLKSIVNKRVPTARAVAPSSPIVTKRPTQAQVQAAAVAAAQQQQQQQTQPPTQEGLGIDLEHPVLPVEVAARRAERLAREKKGAEQQIAARLQMIKAGLIATTSQPSSVSASASPSATQAAVASIASSVQQVISTQVATVATTAISTPTTPGTPPNTLRTQRIIASPIQTSTVVSVASLSAAQLQAATQRLIVSGGTAGQGKTVVATAQGIQGKQAQLAMIRQANLNKQLRLHHHGNIAAAAAAAAAAQGTGQAGPSGGQGQVKTSTVTIGGQQAVVQFTQAQQQQQQQTNARAQFIRQGTVTVGGKGGITRTVTENEVAQLLKKQHQLQQKLGGAGTIQNLSPQVLAQAIQAGSSGTPVATLVKTVSTAGVSQTVTIPVTNVTLATAQGKSLTPAALKAAAAAGATSPQLRQLQIQQQLLAQKKLAAAAAAASGAAGTAGTSGATTAQKLSIAQVQGGKSAVQAQAAQLIVGSKPLGQPMTVQQFQQVMRSPLNVQQGPVVLAKGPPRVIPVNTAQGTKQTIQVVAATSQALSSALRPQNVSSLAGALSGTKVQSATTQQALLSALGQNVGVRLGSPVRLQTTSGTPIVAVSVQNVQQPEVSSQTTNQNEQE